MTLKTILFLAVVALCIINIQSRPDVDPSLVPLIGHYKVKLKNLRADVKKLSNEEIDGFKKIFAIVTDKSMSEADKVAAMKAVAKEYDKGFIDEDGDTEARVKAAIELVDFFTKEIYDKASPRVKNFLNEAGNYGKNFFENIVKSDAELQKVVSKAFDGLTIEDYLEIKMLANKFLTKFDELDKEISLKMLALNGDKHVNKHSSVPAVKAN